VTGYCEYGDEPSGFGATARGPLGTFLLCLMDNPALAPGTVTYF
jgi:hypothetical protein